MTSMIMVHSETVGNPFGVIFFCVLFPLNFTYQTGVFSVYENECVQTCKQELLKGLNGRQNPPL